MNKQNIMTETTELIEEILYEGWNSTNPNKHIVILNLYYQNGGTTIGLFNFLTEKKNKMGDSDFHYYYGYNLDVKIENIISKVWNRDFENHLISKMDKLCKNNFDKLKDFSLEILISDFEDSFRGEIQHIHQFKDYTIIQTQKNDIKQFYSAENIGYVFYTFEECLLHKIFNGKFSDTLNLMLKNKDND